MFTRLGVLVPILLSVSLFGERPTLVLLVRERRALTGRDVLFGVLVGVPNFLSSRHLLAGLTQLPAFLVYPSYSVGVILVIRLARFSSSGNV